MKPLRAVAVLPTLFTLGNLVCGFFAIVVASRIARPGTVDFVPAQKLESVRELINSVDPTHNLMLCGILILTAMLFDVFDGGVARLARVTSDFGAQLDSLCDVVSFGVAPAILLVKMCPDFTEVHQEATWTIAALFTCCVALRLARFNVESDDEDDHSNFVGLPSPAGAAVIASFGILSYTLRNEVNYSNFETFDWWIQRLLPLFAVAIALLMVSRAPYPHLVTQLLRGQHSFAHLVGVLVTLVVLLTMRGFAVPIVCLAYVLAPPLTHAWNLSRRYLRARRM
jgi:CDP-diacylglycerol---serine O-phosphatidyltransferase